MTEQVTTVKPPEKVEDVFDPNYWVKVLRQALGELAKDTPVEPAPAAGNYSDVEGALKEGDELNTLGEILDSLKQYTEQLKEWAQTYTAPLKPQVVETPAPTVKVATTTKAPKAVPQELWDQAFALAVLTGNLAAEAMLREGVSGLDAQRWINAYVTLIKTLADIARGEALE